MNNRTMMIIVAILLVISTIYSIYAILSSENEIEEENEGTETYVSKVVEDECTEEYENIQNATTVSSIEEKLAANALMVLKKYYRKCDHTINEYVELPQELVNMTQQEIHNEYPDW